MSSTDTTHGRHRLVVDGPAVTQTGRHAVVPPSPRRPGLVPTASPSPSPRRPSLVPRSVTVIAATVGAVLAVSVDQQVPAPRPHPDAPGSLAGQNVAGPALEPVVPAQDDGRPARLAALPAGVTGHALAGAHLAGAEAVRSAAAFRAERVVGAVPALTPVQR